MGVLTDIGAVLQSEWGWLITTIVFLYQLFWPLWETKLQSLIGGVESKIDDIRDRQLHQIQVIRALARQTDGVDDETVDEYLVDNGVEVGDFIEDNSHDESYGADD